MTGIGFRHTLYAIDEDLLGMDPLDLVLRLTLMPGSPGAFPRTARHCWVNRVLQEARRTFPTKSLYVFLQRVDGVTVAGIIGGSEGARNPHQVSDPVRHCANVPSAGDSQYSIDPDPPGYRRKDIPSGKAFYILRSSRPSDVGACE